MAKNNSKNAELATLAWSRIQWDKTASLYWTFWHAQISRTQSNSLNHFAAAPPHPTASFYNLINFNFHHFSNSSSHCPWPPTHQPWGVPMPPVLLSYVSRNVPIQTGDQRPSERHMCHFLFSDPIKEEMEAACMNTCTLENAKKYTLTN